MDETRVALLELIPEPAVIRGILARAGAPARPRDLGLGPQAVLDGLLHAHERRPRFTCLSLAARLGLLEQWAAEAVAEAF